MLMKDIKIFLKKKKKRANRHERRKNFSEDEKQTIAERRN